MTDEIVQSEWKKYLIFLMDLAKECPHDDFMKIIKSRLRGDREIQLETRGNVVSPNLGRDEYEENQVVIYAYKFLKKADDQKAILCLRTVVVELLTEALEAKNDLSYIDELGHLMASVEMKESPQLAEKLSESMWSRLGQFENFDRDRLILSSDTELEYVCRTFDVWLTVTPQTSTDCKDQVKQLFENNTKNVGDDSIRQLQFRFLSLMFRALVKFHPYFAGKVAFYELHERLVREKTPKRIRSFNNLCWELGILIRKTEEWQNQFIQGLNEADNLLRSNALKSPLCIDALSRMKLVFSPLEEIGSVIMINRMANEIISEEQENELKLITAKSSRSEKWKKKMEVLNTEGIITSLSKKFSDYLVSNISDEAFRTKVSSIFFSERLRQFVKAALSENFIPLKLILPKIHNYEEEQVMLLTQWKTYIERELHSIGDGQPMIEVLSSLFEKAQISDDKFLEINSSLSDRNIREHAKRRTESLTTEKKEELCQKALAMGLNNINALFCQSSPKKLAA